MKNPEAFKQETIKANHAVYLLFFVSGFPALIYQIVWQRALFTIYGVNIESITVVVAAFMLGLGLGSILGGRLSKNRRIPVLAAFGMTELIIAIFGFNSLRLFEWVGAFTLGSSPLKTGMITFLLVLVPTLMMGATLPLLVTYLVRRTGNVGRSTGVLYFFNTLGSAFACLCTAIFMMGTFGRQGSVTVAAWINLAVSAGALLIHFRQRKERHSLSPSGTETVARTADTGRAVSFGLGLVLVFICGFIALSYEIIWIRLFTVGLASSAAAFPLVLSVYLAGIAWGASEARRFCPNGESGKKATHIRALAVFVLLANLAGFLLVPAAARLFQSLPPGAALLLVIPAAACLGATLPLISHMVIPPDDSAGSRLSFLYLANIIGATVGSLFTGFILMDHWPMMHIALFLALVGFSMVALLLASARVEKGVAVPLYLAIVIVAVLFSYMANALFDRMYERLLFKRDITSGTRFTHVVENRSGVIAVTEDGTVYGEGVYDGRFSVSPVKDTNLIIRAYSLSAFHPRPREVLMIGLSSGSWAQVIANNPHVESLTIVEINPGYLQLIPRYPAVASLLQNPKVTLVIDDGRRWLAKHHERKFDAIVMNTTWHWRSFASNLLSVDFLSLVKAHLNDRGILYYNTTDSPEAQKTGATVFANAFRFYSFMLVSDAPIHVDRASLQEVLAEYRIDGKPVFDLSRTTDREKMKEILSRLDTADGRIYRWGTLETRRDILARTGGAQLITDNNMLTEWQRGLAPF